VLIRNCNFHNNRARGVLLLCHDATVENNRFFHNRSGGLKIESGYTANLWAEGYGASNIVVRNNLFDSVNPQGDYENKPAVFLNVYLNGDDFTAKTAFPILHDILIEKNKFINCPGAIVQIFSARNVIVRDNFISNTIPRKSEIPLRGAVGAGYASDIFVTGNRWQPTAIMPAAAVIYDSRTVRDVYAWGNRVGDK